MPKKPTPQAPAVAPSPDVLGAPAARVLRRFRVVFNAVKTHFRQVEASAGVAGAQVWALSVIAAHPGIGVGGVAQAMDIHQSTASNLLKPLIEKGMVATDRQGVDRRAVHLHISARGAAVLRDVPGPFAGVLPEALGSMEPATLARLDRDLAMLCQLIGADRKGASLPLGQPDGAGGKPPAGAGKAVRAKPTPASRKAPAGSPAPGARSAATKVKRVARG